MSVCFECAKRRVWNEKARQKWNPVECEPCQAKGIGCEECEDKNRATWPWPCPKHAERAAVKAKADEMQKDMERIAQRLFNLETVAEAAKVLVIGDEENMQYGYLRAALERLD